jgi:hypothetical protein
MLSNIFPNEIVSIINQYIGPDEFLQNYFTNLVYYYIRKRNKSTLIQKVINKLIITYPIHKHNLLLKKNLIDYFNNMRFMKKDICDIIINPFELYLSIYTKNNDKIMIWYLPDINKYLVNSHINITENIAIKHNIPYEDDDIFGFRNAIIVTATHRYYLNTLISMLIINN